MIVTDMAWIINIGPLLSIKESRYQIILQPNLDLTAYTFLIYRALTSQMAGLLDTRVSDVIFSSLVPVAVTSHVELHVYLFPEVVSMVTLLHFL